MAVEDDLRSLSEVRGNIYLGWSLGMQASEGLTVWHEGRLQANTSVQRRPMTRSIPAGQI
jgi:hypothetical protein